MRTIWKLKLEQVDVQEVLMPMHSQILQVAVQHGQICLWAIVNPDELIKLHRRFRIIGTGHVVPEEESRFLGTVQLWDGDLVFHVFEVNP